MATMQQTRPLWRATCRPGCGFLLRSADKEEVFRGALTHDRLAHGGKASEARLRRTIEAVPDPRDLMPGTVLPVSPPRPLRPEAGPGF